MEQSNYSIREIKEEDDNHTQYLIYKRDASVDAVLESVPELADTLLSYFDIRNSKDEDYKRAALKTIADYLEPKRAAKKYKGSNYYQPSENLFNVFNRCNIRHNNSEFKQLNKNLRMKIYDDTFKMSLHLMQIDDVELTVSQAFVL